MHALTNADSPARQAPGQSLLNHPRSTPDEPWQRRAVEAFRERMLNPASLFPCVFGTGAVRSGSLRYAYVPAGDDRVRTLAQALVEYTEIAPSLGNRTSLVVFFEPDPAVDTMAAYHDHFWRLLAELREIDPQDWPSAVSPDPDDPSWEFSFNGTSMFLVANTPEHQARRSRHSETFTVTFQPRFVFDDLKVGSPAGDSARVVIRRRLERYDAVPQTPLLGSYGDPNNLEWTQYFLTDENELPDQRRGCPINHALLDHTAIATEN